MFDQAVARTGIKFGVMGGTAGFLVTLLLYFTGNNPYGQLSWWGWVFIPVVVFWGLSYFKKFNDQQLGFLRALFVGWSIAFYTAISAAMLLYVFAYLAGIGPIQNHIIEMKALLAETSAEALKAKVVTPQMLEETYKGLDKTTPSTLAIDDFVKRVFVGFLSAIIGAVFFRK
jgi:hypothetical protein